ncbi:MAG: universal stress protein [Burkholderiales bacterium]|nr:universal stress protein [Burkholderiales bacterium]
MFKRILVPLDGSATAELGLRTAIRMARRNGGTLLLLHVVDESMLALTGDYAGGAYLDRMITDLRDSGRRLVARAAAAARKQGVTARTVLVENVAPRRVSDVIVGEARKRKADLIVIGTHGRRGIRRVVMGSDAEEVVRNTPVPVLLVRSGTRPRA